MAVQCFQEAQNAWVKEEKTLKKEQEMFFQLSIASVYESCGKDDLALHYFIKSKTVKLPYNHPD